MNFETRVTAPWLTEHGSRRSGVAWQFANSALRCALEQVGKGGARIKGLS